METVPTEVTRVRGPIAHSSEGEPSEAQHDRPVAKV